MGKIMHFVDGKGDFPSTSLLNKGITNEGVAFIRKAMAIQPLARFTAPTALNDPWLNNINDVSHRDPEFQINNSMTAISQDQNELTTNSKIMPLRL